MKHFISIARRNLANSLSTMLIYRGNLLFFLVFESMFLASHFLTIGVGFRFAGGNLAGWTTHEAFLLTAISGFTHQLFVCFFINPIFMLAQHVWSGQFDYILMKPLPVTVSAWAISETAISNLPNLLLNLFIALYFTLTSPQELGGIDLATCFAALMCGLIVRIAFALICIAPVFYSERLVGVEESYWSIIGLGRYPLTIYPRWLDRILMFVIPVAAIGYLPAGALYGKLPAWELGAAMAASLGFAWVCYRIFMISVKAYKSVNSGI